MTHSGPVLWLEANLDTLTPEERIIAFNVFIGTIKLEFVHWPRCAKVQRELVSYWLKIKLTSDPVPTPPLPTPPTPTPPTPISALLPSAVPPLSAVPPPSSDPTPSPTKTGPTIDPEALCASFPVRLAGLPPPRATSLDIFGAPKALIREFREEAVAYRLRGHMGQGHLTPFFPVGPQSKLLSAEWSSTGPKFSNPSSRPENEQQPFALGAESLAGPPHSWPHPTDDGPSSSVVAFVVASDTPDISFGLWPSSSEMLNPPANTQWLTDGVIQRPLPLLSIPLTANGWIQVKEKESSTLCPRPHFYSATSCKVRQLTVIAFRRGPDESVQIERISLDDANAGVPFVWHTVPGLSGLMQTPASSTQLKWLDVESSLFCAWGYSIGAIVSAAIVRPGMFNSRGWNWGELTPSSISSIQQESKLAHVGSLTLPPCKRYDDHYSQDFRFGRLTAT